MHYRLAVPEDAPALLQIYSEYIHSTITFEYTLPTTEEFAERIRAIADFYPYIVAEEDGRCMGYAYATVIWNERRINGTLSFRFISPRAQWAAVWAAGSTAA